MADDDTVNLFFDADVHRQNIKSTPSAKRTRPTAETPQNRNEIPLNNNEPPSLSLSCHDRFAQTLQEFILDQEKTLDSPHHQVFDLLLTKHETHSRVLRSLSSNHQEKWYVLERNTWILINLLRQPRISHATVNANFNMTDLDRLEFEFKNSHSIQVLHRVIRWLHLTFEPSNNNGETKSPLDHVYRLMHAGALYFVPQVEMETEAANQELADLKLPSWRMTSLFGGRPYHVKSANKLVRQGNVHRFKWKVSCAKLSAHTKDEMEAQIYHVLSFGDKKNQRNGSKNDDDGNDDDLWKILRGHMEEWSDQILCRHHMEFDQMVFGRSRGEADTEELSISAAATAGAKSKDVAAMSWLASGFERVLLSTSCPRKRFFLSLQFALVFGRMEEFCQHWLGVKMEESNSLSQEDLWRLLAHIVIYLHADASKKLIATQTIDSTVRDAVLFRYCSQILIVHSSPLHVLPYVLFVHSQPLRLELYELALTHLTLVATHDVRFGFLQGLVEVSNEFEEAPLVIDLLVRFILNSERELVGELHAEGQINNIKLDPVYWPIMERFRWIHMLHEMQMDNEAVSLALIVCANTLLTRVLREPQESSIMMLGKSILLMLDVGDEEVSMWQKLFTAWSSFKKLEAVYFSIAEQALRAADRLKRSRDALERKTLFQQREEEVQKEEGKLQALALALLNDVKSVLEISQRCRRFQEADGLSVRNASVGDLVVRSFNLLDAVAKELDQLWKSVHRVGSFQGIYGGCIALVALLAKEASKRLQEGDVHLELFKTQMKSVVKIVQQGAIRLLDECDKPLELFL